MCSKHLELSLVKLTSKDYDIALFGSEIWWAISGDIRDQSLYFDVRIMEVHACGTDLYRLNGYNFSMLHDMHAKCTSNLTGDGLST